MNRNEKNDVVRVRNLSYEYPGVRALDDVTFTVPRGSVTALVGPNGAGKTTLLRCMAALDRPLAGEIEIDGIDVLEQPRECHRRIGYLSDFFGLYGSLTVRQCLAYAARSQGLPQSAVTEAVESTAARLQLSAKLEATSETLSRGQRQRLAIGQALIHRPALLILDEPASGLDPEARHELAGLFRQLRESGTTLIVSSHILAELDEYSTHMLVMRGGRIVENRSLQGAMAAIGRAQMRAAVANADAVSTERLQTAIAALPGVELLVWNNGQAVFGLDDEPQARAVLLQALVKAGVAVFAYTDERENLHETYLRTMQQGVAS